MTAAPKRAKRPSRPIYFTVERLVRPETGESVGALVPSTQWDQRAMRARKYTVGSELRAELKKPRNPKFNALAHALGSILVDNVPGFEGMDAHDALKRVQRECGVQCDEMTIELPGLGRVPVKVPRSLAFDSMPEEDFAQLWDAMCVWIAKNYWSGLDPEEVARMAEIMT